MHIIAVGSRVPPGLVEELTHSDNINDNVDIIRPLLCISSSSVNVVRSRKTGFTCVVKSYSNWKLNEAGRRQVDREIELHRRLEHPHAVSFWLAFDDGTQRHIVMEWCARGTLRHAMGRVSEQQLRAALVVPLLQVLVLLEEQGIVHRDIKPENIFLGEDGLIKLGDFGLAVPEPRQCLSSADGATWSPGASSSGSGSGGAPGLSRFSPRYQHPHHHHHQQQQRPNPFFQHHHALPTIDSSSGWVSCDGSSSGLSGCELASLGSEAPSTLDGFSSGYGGEGGRGSGDGSGGEGLQAGGTPAYTAPEVILAAFNGRKLESAVSCKNDVWALGVLVLELLHGHHPYAPADASSGEVMCTVASGKAIKFPRTGVSPALRGFLSAALAMDPAQRATASDLLSHPWVLEGAAAGADHGSSGVAAGAGGYGGTLSRPGSRAELLGVLSPPPPAPAAAAGGGPAAADTPVEASAAPAPAAAAAAGGGRGQPAGGPEEQGEEGASSSPAQPPHAAPPVVRLRPPAAAAAAWPPALARGRGASRGSSPKAYGCTAGGGYGHGWWGGALTAEPFPVLRRSRSCGRSSGSGKGPLGFMQGLDCWEY